MKTTQFETAIYHFGEDGKAHSFSVKQDDDLLPFQWADHGDLYRDLMADDFEMFEKHGKHRKRKKHPPKFRIKALAKNGDGRERRLSQIRWATAQRRKLRNISSTTRRRTASRFRTRS